MSSATTDPSEKAVPDAAVVRPAAEAAPTLRRRRVKEVGGAPPSSASDGTHVSAAAAPARVTAPAVPLEAQDTLALRPLQMLGLGVAFTTVCLLSLLCSFVLVQFYAVDGLDMQHMRSRLEAAGRGHEPFPVWATKSLFASVTASRAEGGESTRHRAPAPPPPPKRTPALPPTPVQTNTPSQQQEQSSSPSSARLHCYTLETYSAEFLQPRGATAAPPQFSCGTRVVDLRTEERADVRAACHGVDSDPREWGQHGEVRLSTLRVVLTSREVEWHRALQPTNLVTQRIPLSHVNDDYCDCLDGTDELLTNACSMSGPLTPAAGARWRSYLVSTQPLRLWEADDTVAQEDAEERGYPLQPRKRGDVGDRLYISTGPVLPFLCTCGSVRQLLPPSLVGDGVVDCCAAEDEAVLQGTPYGAAVAVAPSPSKDRDVVAAHNRALDAMRAAMLTEWQRRKASAAAYPVVTPSPYADALYPYHTSARAMLVDKGYYSLFTPLEVQEARLAAAVALEQLYARGHRIQRNRARKGWDRLGMHLADNKTKLQQQLSNITRDLDLVEQYVRYRLSEARTNDPIAAGVSMQQLQHHAHLMQMREGVRSELQHISITTEHRAYGDHYEYYPLVRRILHVESHRVVRTASLSYADDATARRRDARVMSPSQMDEMNNAAYASQRPAPPIHVDNISASHYGIEVMRQTFAAQRFSEVEAPFVAQRLGLLPRGELSAYSPNVFQGISSPFQRAPVLPIGSWQPYYTLRDARTLLIADPSGDVHLARRACVAPASSLFRGGGRLQLPTRHPEAPRVMHVSDSHDEQRTAKDKLKAAAAGEAAKGSQVYIPYHTHMPSVFAVNVFASAIRCDHDPPPASASRRGQRATQHGGGADKDASQQHDPPQLLTHVTYLCDTKDRVLHWAENGKCLQEVIVGTPSACTGWAWRVAAERVKALRADAVPATGDSEHTDAHTFY
ncbi:Glucosidase II beta subunit-like [Novymonas esmeraldas]|uniref:Glucosidase II beta subunit-like n=1 Tax=Novymonas esmeraldas TaxID=1808958 RepID=A0AAW0EWL5_9TRYP